MDGTTALVTGVSRGIGAALARRFVAEGAHVVGCARDADALETLAEEIRADSGGTDDAGGITVQRADVRDEYDVERLAETAARAGGNDGIDLVVANAGIYHGSAGETPLNEESYAAVDEHLRTNARGVFATIRESLPHLAANARVLVPSGAVAREAQSGMGSYAVSKAAAEALARGFAAETDQPVGVVDPGQVATDLAGDGGRDPEEIAEMFVWAANDVEPDDLDGEILDLRAWRQATR
ncbi:SDR family oxidoreductase [Halococcus saccharolyticus]|uniref:Short chain dehydrogenase n=1 Tax=Halococcus saccharolyticus DSM 5350 TaxID=1227455 RepID=M0MDZ0_9EURY|nr:SDR family oxidoreductase [Halococcus saccharolyticus]EMA43972.1 short chain dehydrogenase [Halococcus saccharolyticus DSM 5350]